MTSAARWWLEWEFWVVLLLAGLIYGMRLGDAMPSGEEPRWGQVAREMITSGDWIVPRQQGLPFLSRPPVQNWAIALMALVRGKVDFVAIRFPSVVALLLTTALIYAYGRTFLSRFGALWAAAAYPTMGLVLQFGWLGETESLYTLVVAGSLMVWRWADVKQEARWPHGAAAMRWPRWACSPRARRRRSISPAAWGFSCWSCAAGGNCSVGSTGGHRRLPGDLARLGDSLLSSRHAPRGVDHAHAATWPCVSTTGVGRER